MATIDTDVLLLAEFVNDAGARYNPSPAPTVTVNRVNASDGSSDVLQTAQVTIATGITGIYAYILDADDNDELGTLEGVFTTTDTGIAALLRTAYAFVDVEAAASVDPTSIAAAVWNYATASAGAVTTFGGYLLSKLNAIGTATAYALTPTPTAHTVRVVRGDDYSASDGRAIDLVYSGHPSFTGASAVTLKVVRSEKAIQDTILTLTGEVLDSTTLRFTPTSAELSASTIPAISDATQVVYPFEVQVTLSSSRVITPTPLTSGRWYFDQQAS